MVPLAAALYLATSMFRQASAIWFNPEIGEQLDRGVDVYKDYVKAIKDDLKHQTVAMAADPVLRDAAKRHNIETVESEIDALVLWVRGDRLLTDDETIERMVPELGFRRRGKRIEAAIRRSIQRLWPRGDSSSRPST